MGSFYGSVHVRTEDRPQLLQALGDIARAGKTRFLVSPPAGGWTGIYPSEGGQDFAVSAAVAARVTGPVLHLVLHDEDVFAYRLYDAGGVIDEYDSNPDYFQESSPARWNETAGRPQALAALGGKGDVTQFARILSRERGGTDPFRAGQQLEGVAALLGIANVETSYEYLQDGDAEGVKGRKRFVHIPDLSAEKEARRRHKADVTAALKKLERDGVLLVAKKATAGRYGLPWSPAFCASPQGGFVVAWCAADAPDATTIEWWRAPWREPLDPGLRIETRVTRMSASRDGRFLAVDRSSRQWTTDVFDVRDWRLVTTIAVPNVAKHVGFTDDGRFLIWRSQSSLRLVATDHDHVAQTLNIGNGASAAVHPEGRWLVADVRDGHACGVALVDLGEMRLVRVMSTVRHDLTAWMAEVSAGKAVTGFRPQEVPTKVGFSPDGGLLILGVEDGVRIYSWNEVLDARGSLPPPRAAADSALVQVPSSLLRHTYGFAWDGPRARVLSPALDGHVHALDVASGAATTILKMPGTPPLGEMAVADDGATFALVVHSGLFERGRRPPPVWQVWNLDLLDSRRLRVVR